MPPVKELPGFYFDPERNRYFPLKGPIPGSKRPYSASSSTSGAARLRRCENSLGEPSTSNQVDQFNERSRKKRSKSFELLRLRELHGGCLIQIKCKRTFKKEYQNLQAAHPMVWQYKNTTRVADTALEHFAGIIQTSGGLVETNLLATASIKGSFRLYDTGNDWRNCDYGIKCMPQLVWPSRSDCGRDNILESIWTSSEASTSFSSYISCITTIRKHSSSSAGDDNSFPHALVTTLGSGASGGSVYVLNLSDPIDFSTHAPLFRGRMTEIASFDCTIWTGDSSPSGIHAAVGTNLGAAVVNLENGVRSWVYRSKSDVFSQQFDRSGNILLCGLRSGAIIPIDIRQKQPVHSEPSVRYRGRQSAHVPHVPSSRPLGRFARKKAELKSNSSSTFMSSSVCSMVMLQSDEQYLLGSSMDGFIKLYDLRLLQRGAVQSYNGHVNSHTRLKIAVDPSENLIMSGGEDNIVRIWSIKNGRLLFAENVTNSIVSTCCWTHNGESARQGQAFDQRMYEPTQSWGAWLGSLEGLFYMHGS